MLNKNTMVDKDELIEELRLKVELMTDAVAHLRKETPEQPGLREELAQYKEWFEAMTRQLAKRHNQIHELTTRIKEIRSTQLEDCSLRGQRDRAIEKLDELKKQFDACKTLLNNRG